MAVVIGVEVCVDASVVPLVGVEPLVTDPSEVVSLLVVVVAAAVVVSLVVAKVDDWVSADEVSTEEISADEVAMLSVDV